MISREAHPDARHTLGVVRDVSSQPTAACASHPSLSFQPGRVVGAPASCRDSCRSHSVKRDEICKALEKGREEIPCRLVHEATVGPELLVRVSHENLRLQECVRVGEYKCLAQLRLAARGSGHPGRGAHHSGNFTVQSAVPRRGLDSQSIVFFSTPGTPWLYSGVAISNPSAFRMTSRS